jgi:short-subunit dehydrogenase
MEVNFFAAAELIRAATPLLAQGRTPMVVNIGSVLGHRGIPHTSEYCASKFALHGLSESIRPELARLGIDVLVVAPGSTKTELADHLIDKQGERPWKELEGVPAAQVARRAVRAIERGSHEIFPTWSAWWLAVANGICPRIVDKALKRYG